MNAQELLDKIKELPDKPVDVPTAPPIELVAMVVRWARHLKHWKATILADFACVSLSTVERVLRGDKVSDDSPTAKACCVMSTARPACRVHDGSAVPRAACSFLGRSRL
jgi:hypothetical protein